MEPQGSLLSISVAFLNESVTIATDERGTTNIFMPTKFNLYIK